MEMTSKMRFKEYSWVIILGSNKSHTHYSSWEGGVSSNFPIDFYAAFLIFHNHRDFSIIEGIFKTIPMNLKKLLVRKTSFFKELPQNHCQGNRLSQFVGTGSGSGSLLGL